MTFWSTAPWQTFTSIPSHWIVLFLGCCVRFLLQSRESFPEFGRSGTLTCRVFVQLLYLVLNPVARFRLRKVPGKHRGIADSVREDVHSLACW